MATVGAYILMAGWLIFLYMMLNAWRHGKIAPANPWHAKTLEWKVPTPVPLENFLVDPVVTSDPYTYGELPRRPGGAGRQPVEEPELVPAGSGVDDRAMAEVRTDVDHHHRQRRHGHDDGHGHGDAAGAENPGSTREPSQAGPEGTTDDLALHQR